MARGKIIQFRTSVAANGVQNDILAGTQLQNAPQFGDYAFFGSTLLADNNLTVFADQLIILDAIPLTVKATPPIQNEDLTGPVENIARGTQLLARINNTNVAANIPNLRIEFHPVGRSETMLRAREAMGVI